MMDIPLVTWSFTTNDTGHFFSPDQPHCPGLSSGDFNRTNTS
jgi:hypothetical protein